MTVGKDDGVHLPDVESQRLRADVGPRINQQRLPVVRLHVDRRTPALVARIRRTARLAIAADHRHAVRRPGTKKCDAQWTGWLRLDDALLALLGLDVAHAQFVEEVIEELR